MIKARRDAHDQDELAARDTVLATTEPELGALDTQIAGPALGTRDTALPLGLDATARSEAALPRPEIDRLDFDRIRGAIMEDLFGAKAAATRIGRFTVLGRLGEGGMGVVYAAYDEQLDRKVAVKVLRGDLVGHDHGARLRLVREAQAMARVTHTNLITVHEAGEHEGQIFVAMEYVRGRSLDAWLAERPGWRAVVDVFLAAGAGLAAAHAAGLVHRDFKPHNVMRGDDGSVKVLDFGLARAVGASDALLEGHGGAALVDARLTRTGSIMGTPAYMSPEQHEGAELDERSDQFSFCVALYEGLYGKLPFTGDTMVELVANVRGGRMRPLPADAAVPAWALRVVLRGLARAPADRFPTMGELLAALARDPARQRRRVLAIGGLAAVMAVGGFATASLAADRGPAPCTGGTDEIAAIWGEQQRGAIAAAMGAADPLGAATWSRIAPRIDAHADAWVAMRGESCEAHLAGRQSPHLLDLRMACLDRRRAGLAALLGRFAAADSEVVLAAVTAVDGMASIDGCGDASTHRMSRRLASSAPRLT